MLSALVGLVVAAVIGFVALTVILAVLGMIFGLAFGVLGLVLALAFKVLPLVLIGWVVVKLVQRGERGSRPAIASSDRRWLDS
jgi:hypothetical protein